MNSGLKNKISSEDKLNTGTEAVLFDLDGVLVDSMKFHAGAWVSAMKDYGYEVEELEIYKREGMAGYGSVLDILRIKGYELPDSKKMDEIYEHKHRLFEQNSVQLFPHVNEIIAHLKSRGICTGLVTGSLMRAVTHLLGEEFISVFDSIIASDDVVRGKPDPEPYLKAAAKINIDPSKCVVIENAPMGIESAKNAGMCCYAIETSLPEEYLLAADRIFKNHTQLFEFIKKEF